MTADGRKEGFRGRTWTASPSSRPSRRAKYFLAADRDCGATDRPRCMRKKELRRLLYEGRLAPRRDINALLSKTIAEQVRFRGYFSVFHICHLSHDRKAFTKPLAKPFCSTVCRGRRGTHLGTQSERRDQPPRSDRPRCRGL